MNEKQQNSKNDNLLMQYLGMATQFIVSLALGVYAGYWLDHRIKLSFPLLVWVLPLLIIVALMVRVIKDTLKKK